MNLKGKSNGQVCRGGITPNVARLGEEAEIEAEKFKLAPKLNRNAKAQLTAKTAFLPNLC